MTLPGDEPAMDREGSPVGLGSAAVAADPAAIQTTAIPSMLATVSRGLDLDVAASGQIRRASLYVGLLWLLTLAPIAVVVWAHSARLGGFEWLRTWALGWQLPGEPTGPLFGLLFNVVFAVGFVGAVSLWIDSALLATALLAGRATGRVLDLRATLALARLVYWRLVRAEILVGLILLVPRVVLNGSVTTGSAVPSEAQVLILSAVDVVVSTPFAYVTVWVVLGGVGAWAAVRGSWRLARARWRLALLIAVYNAAVAYLAAFALGAGADILIRLGAMFGLGDTMGPAQAVVLAAIIGLALASIGSLMMTIAALTAGPQVVAFLALTGSSAGLDAVRNPDNPFARARVEPLVSRPMTVALAISASAAALAILTSP
jgi:hypothetical protein